MSPSGLGNIVSKTHTHQAQSHSIQSTHGYVFMPMQALPPPLLPRSMPSYPPGKKKRGPSQILS
ncbi:hypothetical protein WCP94_001108 [Bilophila wadsworthia]